MADRIRHRAVDRDQRNRLMRAVAVPVSGMRSAAVIAKNTRPYGPRISIAARIGCDTGRAIFTAHAAAAPSAAAVQSFAVYSTGSPVLPIRALRVDRSSSISTHPAIPADAVSPAAPHI